MINSGVRTSRRANGDAIGRLYHAAAPGRDALSAAGGYEPEEEMVLVKEPLT